MRSGLTLRQARPEDLAWISAWLGREALPVTDLSPALMRAFQIAERDAATVGFAGLETFSRCGLLRSVVIDPQFRGSGLGSQLVAALETRARRAGLDELWLLTIDAAAFFKTLGFAVAERSSAPAAIQETPEFARLCPADAVLMHKRL